ncbi:MAG: diaminopimelate decarboxylase [Candidatus Abawacabacteria bacterium]|nr:diaminopimelate decarboxylase [Candidatus Abawacabacteria bacterium]
MMKKLLPFTLSQVQKWVNTYPTPFYVYDERGIRNICRRLKKAFSWLDFKQYYAVKALPNPSILQILKDEGLGADCSSLAELYLAEMAGISGQDIMYTSNNTLDEEFQKAHQMGAIINLDDISHIEPLERVVGIPEILSFRFNPGKLREGNSIIGKPEEAKYGLTKDQLFKAYQIMQQKGVKRFGIHTMIASNELDPDYFVKTAEMLFDLVIELKQKLGISCEIVNIGGGVGIPYKPEQDEVDLEYMGNEIQKLYQQKVIQAGLQPFTLAMECGRLITGPYGYLVTRAIRHKNTYKNYVGVDACMANLMRPGMYGAYHHISVLGKEQTALDHVYDITGGLCENNDKFAIDRALPQISDGDILVIHDAGAHGHAMGFNYNGKLRSAEFLLRENSELQMIRRGETLDDHFATLKF